MDYKIGVLYYFKPKDDIACLHLLLRETSGPFTNTKDYFDSIKLTSWSYTVEQGYAVLPKHGKTVRLATNEEVHKFVRAVFEEEYI